MNTAILSPTGGSIGIGFSMASNVVAQVVDQLQEFGETRRGWLGVRIQDVTDDVAEALGLDAVAGALVTDVLDGPAAQAGMLAGDVIIALDGVKIANTRALVRQVGETAVGKTVRVVVYRDGSTRTLKVTLTRREDAEGIGDSRISGGPDALPDTPQTLLGLTLSPLDDDLRAQLGLPDMAGGLVVQDIDPLSQAYEKGLRAGDVITEAGQQALNTVADLERQIVAAREAGRRSLLLLVRTNGQPHFVALTFDDE